MKPEFETQGTALTVRLPAELDHPVSDEIRRETGSWDIFISAA